MPKVETFLSPEQIVQIENMRGEQSRSNWIKEAVQVRMEFEKQLSKYLKGECTADKVLMELTKL